MTEPKYYYHITKEKKIERILRNGLLPRLGKNSSIAGESRHNLYLTDAKSIPYWLIILGGDTVLRIPENVVKNPECYEYFTYSNRYYYEYIVADRVAPKYLSFVDWPFDNRDVMIDLCNSYVQDISNFCVMCAKYYSSDYHDGCCHTAEMLDDIKIRGEFLLSVLPRFDYSIVDKDFIRQGIRREGDLGAFTLCDYYYTEGKRLYEKLIEYEDDELTQIRQIMNQWICENLEECLAVETGGFC